MTDNVPITPGSGASVATDDIGGVHYQRVKVCYGTDGNFTEVSTSNPLPTTPQASETHLGAVSGQTVAVAASFSRPTDTSPYTALDVVCDSASAPTVLSFSNIARVNQGSGYITKARLLTDQKTNTARFRLHLFSASPTAINDNSPFLLLWANRADRVGYIDFDACITEDSSNSTAAGALNASIRLAFNCASASRTLYGILETRDGFTPANAQNFYIELTAEQN